MRARLPTRQPRPRILPADEQAPGLIARAKADADRKFELRVISAVRQYLTASGYPHVAKSLRQGRWRAYL